MSRATSTSRIVLSGSVADVDGLRRLVWAIRSDSHRNGGVARSVDEVIDFLESNATDPLEIEGGGRGAVDFYDVRRICQRLAVSFVHEFSDGRLGRVDCHLPALMPSFPSSFYFNGTIAHPAIDLATYAGAAAYDDGELGAAFRRECMRIEKAVGVASAPFAVEASALDELRNASRPATGRGLL